jgi:hypothetical protein
MFFLPCNDTFKCTIEHAMKHTTGGWLRRDVTLSLTSTLDGSEWSTLCHGRFTYGKETRPRDRSGRVRKMSPSPGFEPRIVQPAASRYIVYTLSRPPVIPVLWLTLTMLACIRVIETHQNLSAAYLSDMKLHSVGL